MTQGGCGQGEGTHSQPLAPVDDQAGASGDRVTWETQWGQATVTWGSQSPRTHEDPPKQLPSINNPLFPQALM